LFRHSIPNETIEQLWSSKYVTNIFKAPNKKCISKNENMRLLDSVKQPTQATLVSHNVRIPNNKALTH